MVKNTHGGNKSKGMARKNMNTSSGDRSHLRLPSCELEKIAFVSKLLGNGMFYAITTDDVQLLGRIRNKFKGRSRRGNDIVVGKIVLVGLREWEAPNYKECDLLLVYEPHDVENIKLNPTINLSAFAAHGLEEIAHDVHFDDSNDISFQGSDEQVNTMVAPQFIPKMDDSAIDFDEI
jgi:translation initiation factor IF-1